MINVYAVIKQPANLPYLHTPRKFIRGLYGRDLTKPELADYDTEVLVGMGAQLVVVHEHKDGETYANIAARAPDKSGNPLKPTGKYVRLKDRPPKDGAGRAAPAGHHGGYPTF